MGQGSSAHLKDLDGVSENERFFGLENFGNTCYINSVVQALFYCSAFRDGIIAFVDSLPPDYEENSVLFALADLFKEIKGKPKKSGCIAPKHLVRVIQQTKPEFHSPMHQDAQELLSFLLNHVCESMRAISARLAAERAGSDSGDSSGGGARPSHARAASSSAASTPTTSKGSKAGEGEATTLVDDIFVGKTVTNTLCVSCESLSRKEEDFKEFQIEIRQPDTTLERCVQASSTKELMQADNKLHCTKCHSYEEGYKWVEIDAFPAMLIFHLNRFAFSPHLEQGHKLKHRVAFSNRFTPPADAHSPAAGPVQYELSAVVVHVGTALAHGHFITYVHRAGRWFCYDDTAVSGASQKEVEGCFGDANAWSFHNDMHAYLLFYRLLDAPPAPAAATVAGGAAVESPTAAAGGEAGVSAR